MKPLRLQDISGNDVNQFLLEVQRGEIPGARIVSRLGKNPDIDAATEDLWELGGLYNELTANTTLYMWSTDNSDTVSIKFTGVDEGFNQVLGDDGNPLEVSLTGITPVTIPKQFLSICQIENEGSTPLAGTVYVSRVSNSTLASNVVATISIGNEVSLLGRCAIPAGYTGYLIQGETSANVTSVVNLASAVTTFYTKLFGKVYKLTDEVYAGVQAARPFDVIPEKSLLKTTATTYDSNTSVRATFWILLLDNEVWGGV